MSRYTSFAAFMFFAISLIVPSGYSFGAALLMLGGIPLIRQSVRLHLTREDKVLIAVLLFYFAVTVAMLAGHGEKLKEYDMPLRFLLAVPALLAMLAYPPKPSFFWAGLIVGGIAAGIFSGWQNIVDSVLRAGGYTNPIQYGNVSFLVGMLCFAGLGWAKEQPRTKSWMSLLVIGGVMGLLGAIFTGSRGSWIGLPVCLIIFCWHYRNVFNFRYVFGSLTILIGLLLAIYLIPRSEVEERGHKAIAEAKDYLMTGNADSSVGTRMELWRVGVLMAEEHPLLGWGKNGMVLHKAEMIREQRASPATAEYNHLHNDWLDATVKRGIPGLIAVLSLYLIPLYIFSGYLRRGTAAQRHYALCGVTLIVSYFSFGLTQVFMSHIIGVMILSFSLAIIWGMLRGTTHAPIHATLRNLNPAADVA